MSESDNRSPGPQPQVETVELPVDVVERVEARLDRAEAESVDEYVAFVLEETLARVEAETEDDHTGVSDEQIQSRLESLGYLD